MYIKFAGLILRYDRERICDFGADPLLSESIIELHRLNGKYIISKTIVIYFDAE